MATAKKFTVDVVIPEGYKAGDTLKVTVEAPEVAKRTRGALNGIALEDMDLEQLKREKINASSVLYKATKRGAEEATIAANTARVEAVKAELAKRAPAVQLAAGVVGEVLSEEEEGDAEDTEDAEM